MMAALLLLALVQAPDTGRVLYRAWCSSCHGEDGRGVSRSMTQLEVPAADLANCRISSAEPEDRWVGIVRDGGDAYGLSMDMPAFGEHADDLQLRQIVRYTRDLCGDHRWPPGELNFPRGFSTEKAFPENEIVLVAQGREQRLIYERRFGPRLQLEGIVSTVLDGGSAFGGVTAAGKYNVWHSLRHRALASVGLEATPPWGRQAEWEIEPFLAAGISTASGWILQAEGLAIWEEGAGVAAFQLGGGLGLERGRVVPMVEGRWRTFRNGVPAVVTVYPQMWVQLSRLGHVAASLGVEVPVRPAGSGDARIIAFLLWDFGDGGLTRGW